MTFRNLFFTFTVAAACFESFGQPASSSAVKQYQIEHRDNDVTPTAQIDEDLHSAINIIEKFFGAPFKNNFTVNIYPSRAHLDKQWQQDWSVPDFKSDCWMVASGVARKIDLLSPTRWSTEACEHNVTDTLNTRKLIVHEAVHVYHGQLNPSGDFSSVERIDWLVEGVATYISGQLTEKKFTDIRQLSLDNKLPQSLDNFWKGKNKYGLSGSIVQYIDKQYGRKMLFHLLALTTQAQVLEALKTTEKELIENFVVSLKKA